VNKNKQRLVLQIIFFLHWYISTVISSAKQAHTGAPVELPAVCLCCNLGPDRSKMQKIMMPSANQKSLLADTSTWL
jgi:hypothetical protein